MGRSGHRGSVVEDGSGGTMITGGLSLYPWAIVCRLHATNVDFLLCVFIVFFRVLRAHSNDLFKDAQCIRRALMPVYSLSLLLPFCSRFLPSVVFFVMSCSLSQMFVFSRITPQLRVYSFCAVACISNVKVAMLLTFIPVR